MCVTFLALSSGVRRQAIGGKYSLILLNNRDVDFDRATSALCWRDGILACWDEQAEERGTWLGISKSGRVGVLLSITEPPQTLKQNSPSRGTLVRDLLSDPSPPFACLSAIAPKQEQFNGFQLLAIDSPSAEMGFLSNRFPTGAGGPIVWPHGVYGFGNSPRHLPFKKVDYGEAKFSRLISNFDFARCDETDLVHSLFDIASDKNLLFPDEQIRQQTGCPLNSDAYKFLCSIFVDGTGAGRNYGTMSTSVILVEAGGTAVFHERRVIGPQNSMDNPEKWKFSMERFAIDSSDQRHFMGS